MTIQRAENPIHWNYFLALEDDLDRLSRFVDFSKNDDTYSIEIARLFLSACSEIDVILKQICKNIDPASTASSINAYYKEITPAYPKLVNFEVLIPKYAITLTPLSNWAENNPPFWWQDHNKVKHHRHENFERANLKNCLNTMASLFVFTLYFYIDKAENGELIQFPKLFKAGQGFSAGVQIGGLGLTAKYNLRNTG
jgi:hypothetical protein